MLGMDRARYNASSWNPLGEIIKPGNIVLIKPNFVKESNPGVDFSCLVTQSSIIRAIADYIHIALQGRGKIIIADAPIQGCDFDQLIENSGLHDMLAFCKKNFCVPVELADLRSEVAFVNDLGMISRKPQEGDKAGYSSVDLKEDSELFEIINAFERFRCTNYGKEKMRLRHNKEKNEYVIANSFLNADVVINLPKLKTHKRAGMTCALKNMVGINGIKDCLAHHRFGSSQEGGDEYLYKSFRKKLISTLCEIRDAAPKKYQAHFLKFLFRLIRCVDFFSPYKDPYNDGSWYGNDTLPRVIADLNKIAFYADKKGGLRNTLQRKNFIIVDGITAGEMEGPLYPTPKHCGLLVAGDNSVAVDLVCSRIMGFDYTKIPTFKYCMHSKIYPLFQGDPEAIDIISDYCSTFAGVYKTFGSKFTPSKGWSGHIEYNEERE
ncbi:MAG: DUF362 domain-containing protein [Pseudomonadota bacterium]